ncbi:MAG: ComF family protein [Terriglobales bacterium]
MAAPPTPGAAGDVCPRCQQDPPLYASAHTTASYEGAARALLLLFKYGKVASLGRFWAARMAAVAAGLQPAPQIVVALPLGRGRERERGFNQSSLMGGRLAGRLRWKAPRGALARIRETASQTGLNPAERERNVAGAFRATPRLVAGRHVLLVDDILTTGATARAAAVALRQAGAARIDLLTAARAELRYHSSEAQ